MQYYYSHIHLIPGDNKGTTTTLRWSSFYTIIFLLSTVFTVSFTILLDYLDKEMARLEYCTNITNTDNAKFALFLTNSFPIGSSRFKISGYLMLST